jgi:hypothetical protein
VKPGSALVVRSIPRARDVRGDKPRGTVTFSLDGTPFATATLRNESARVTVEVVCRGKGCDGAGGGRQEATAGAADADAEHGEGVADLVASPVAWAGVGGLALLGVAGAFFLRRLRS